jgi:NADH dehydrogenase
MGDEPRVLILGGGYAGATLARRLADAVDVTLISDDNFLLSTPMLAEVAAGYLDPRHIVTPLRDMCPHANVIQGTVYAVDVESASVTVEGPLGAARRTFEGDVLVMALGAVPADFGVEGVAEHALDFKTIGDALAIRNRVLAALEGTAVSDDPRLTRTVVVGAGYSGAELAAALSDFVHEAAATYFGSSVVPQVTLVDAVDRVTPALSARLSAAAAAQLAERRVEMRLGTKVASVDAEGVAFEDGSRIDAATVVWAAGVRPNPLAGTLGLPTERGRLVTDGRMQVSEKVFALGDVAAVPDGSGAVSPPTAQFAVRQGRYLGDSLPKMLAGETVPRFRYRTLGELVSLGHHNAVGRIARVPVSGLPAWFLWRTYYLAQVPSLFRRARIAFDWTLDVIFPPDIAWIPASSKSLPEVRPRD